MTRKIRIILLIFSLSITLSFMSNTYSRYVADTTGNLEILFAKWQILVNDSDITNQTSSTIELNPIVEENDNIAYNTIAPSSKGYFDIDINPENVGVSFEYEITLDVLNKNMPDLMITKYSILDKDYQEGEQIDISSIEGNSITGTLNYDNKTENFKFEPFTIRIYFEWYEGTNEKMDDEADTAIGTNDEDTKLDIEASIQFRQKL